MATLDTDYWDVSYYMHVFVPRRQLHHEDELRLAVDACISIMKRLLHSARMSRGAGFMIDVVQKDFNISLFSSCLTTITHVRCLAPNLYGIDPINIKIKSTD